MSINLTKIKPYKPKKDAPFLCVGIGVQGAGKSTVGGTLPAKRILWIYSKGEMHGVDFAAGRSSSDIYPICLDNDDNGLELTPDQQIERLLEILNDPTLSSKVDGIVLDGALALQDIYVKTKECKKQCVTTKGEYNQWREYDVVKVFLRDVVIQLTRHWEKGVHVYVTCPGEIVISEESQNKVVVPKLRGFGVANEFMHMFRDIVCCIAKYDKDGKVKYEFSFDTMVEKTSEEKIRTHNPRLAPLQGVGTDLPSSMPADFGLAFELKTGKRKLIDGKVVKIDE